MSDTVGLYLTCPTLTSEQRLVKGREFIIGRVLFGGDPQAAEQHCSLICDLAGKVTVKNFASGCFTAIESVASSQHPLAKKERRELKPNETRTLEPGETLLCGQSRLTLAPRPSARPAQDPPRPAPTPPHAELQALLRRNQELQALVDEQDRDLAAEKKERADIHKALQEACRERDALRARVLEDSKTSDSVRQLFAELLGRRKDEDRAGELAAVAKRIRALEAEKKDLADSLDRALTENGRLSQEQQGLREAVRDAAQGMLEREALRRERDEGRGALAKSQEELAAVRQELARLTARHAGLELFYQQKIRDRHTELQLEVETLRKELTTERQTALRLAAERAQLERLYQQKIRDRHTELQLEVETLRQELSALRLAAQPARPPSQPACERDTESLPEQAEQRT